MGKYNDSKKAGQSQFCPHKPNESASSRHHRRKQTAQQMINTLGRWCRKQGWALELHNNRHHWQIREEGDIIAEWWPSSAKLVIGEDYRNGVHCHDVQQVISTLKKET